MPETVSGPGSDPGHGYSGQGIKDTLARLEAKIDRLAEKLADAEAEAEEIIRRAAVPATPSSPRRRSRSPGRRGDTFLRVVKAAVIAAVSLGAVFAFLASPVRLHQQRYSPRCSLACSRTVARVDSDHDGDAR